MKNNQKQGEFDLPDESYSIADYFEFIIKSTKPQLKILLYKFTPIKSKTGLVSKYKEDTNQNYYLQKQSNYQELQKKMLIKIKMEKMCQNQNLLKLFWCIIIQSITIIKKHQKYYLLLCQINNLGSQLIQHHIHQ